MIIAAYAGTGKSFFARKYPNEAIDLCSMPYTWLLADSSGGEYEGGKGAKYLLSNPAYPDNYIAAILDAQKKYKYVLIPSNIWLLMTLELEYDLPIILCYPAIDLKDEYVKRYIQRGNSSEFIGIFAGDWENRIHNLTVNADCSRIVLNSGMFLTDVKDEIDRLSGSFAQKSSVNEELIDQAIKGLNRAADINLKDGCIAVYDGESENCASYFPLDLTVKDNRQFAYEAGKLAYENGIKIKGECVECIKYSDNYESIVELHSRRELTDLLNKG